MWPIVGKVGQGVEGRRGKAHIAANDFRQGGPIPSFSSAWCCCSLRHGWRDSWRYQLLCTLQRRSTGQDAILAHTTKRVNDDGSFRVSHAHAGDPRPVGFRTSPVCSEHKWPRPTPLVCRANSIAFSLWEVLGPVRQRRGRAGEPRRQPQVHAFACGNKGRRNTMEDEHVILDDALGACMAAPRTSCCL